MTTENIYKPAQSMLQAELPQQSQALLNPRVAQCPARAGLRWVSQGWCLFLQSPGRWVLLAVVYFILQIVFTVVPFVSMVTWLFGAVFSGSILLGARATDTGQVLQIKHLFSGFSGPRFGMLVGVQALMTISSVVLGMVTFVVVFAALGLSFSALTGTEVEPVEMLPGFIFAIVAAILCVMTLSMGYLFAVPLVAISNVPVFDAIKLSFRACLKNMWPLTVYSLAACVVVFIGLVSLIVGILVAMPVLMLAWYAAYCDIFFSHESTGLENESTVA